MATGTLDLGTWELHNGTPRKGSALIQPVDAATGRFIPEIVDAAGHKVYSGAVRVQLVSGHGSADLPASDDLTLNPSGFVWRVDLALDGEGYSTQYVAVLSGKTVYLTNAVDPDPVAPTYAERVDQAAESASAASAAQSAAAASASAASAAQSAAAASASAASTSAGNAASSATAAAGSATNAATSATSAAASLTALNAAKGAANGIAPLDSGSRVPEANLPANLAAATLSATYAAAIHVKPGSDGVVGNGTGDDTAAVQALLDKVSPALGVVDVVIHDGTYMVNAVNTAQTTGQTRNNGNAAGLKPKSGTRLLMSSNAILRVIPNGSPGYSCISLESVSGVTIRGGKIEGDRATHDYASEPTYTTHEWGTGISIKAATDILIEGVTITGCTGDAIGVGYSGNITYPNLGTYTPSRRITIRKCVLDGSRRNNISVTGCDLVLIEGNAVSRAGYDDGIKAGAAPKCGIDIESDGETGPLWYGTALNVTVRNNTFTANTIAAVMNYNGMGVTITGNYSDSLISHGYGTDTTITGNVVKNTANTTGIGIGTNQMLVGDPSYREGRAVISNNVIYGFGTGIDVGRDNMLVANNFVTGFATSGITLRATKTMVVGNQIIDGANQTSAISLIAASECQIRSNRISGVYRVVRFQTASSNILFSGNSVGKCWRGLDIGSLGTNLTISDNTFRPTGWGEGQESVVSVSGTSTLVVKGNVFYPGTGTSPVIGSSTTGSLEIIGNQFLGHTGVYTLSLAGGTPRIVGNTFTLNRTSNGSYPILLGTGTTKALIMQNTAYNVNTNTWAYLVNVGSSAASNTRVLGNTVVTQTGTGSLVTGTDGGTLVESGNVLVAP